MLKHLRIKNLTVFPDAELRFGRHLNVIVGENGLGKTHLLKMPYCILAVSAEEGRKPNAASPTKSLLQSKIADKLVNVFRPEYLGRLARRKQGRERCDIALGFNDLGFRRRSLAEQWDIECSFSTNNKSEVSIDRLPQSWVKKSPVYLPTRELLTIFPNFISVYESHYLEFEETWRDTCILLGAPIQRGARSKQVQDLLAPLEEAMEGTVEFDKNGRFYLKAASGRMEMPLVAEGLRKLAMLARLIATGALLDQGYLFWDEPEANLNPKLVKAVARTILDLSKVGIQIFIATHSLFLLRELDILLSLPGYATLDAKFFGLHKTDDGVGIAQGDRVDEIGDIAALGEELAQSDRFLAQAD